jgi:hypothetical protein
MKITISIAVVCMVAFMGGVACAEQKGPAEAVAQSLVRTVAEGCKAELETYCKDVTPGEGRVLACLYAYEDKLSNRCEYALYDAASQLQIAVTALTYAANECRDDLKAYCSSIEPGQGRLLQCLNKNNAKVSSRCKQALKDTGLK